MRLALLATGIALACLALGGCGDDDGNDGVFEVIPADLVIFRMVAPLTGTLGQVVRVEVTVSNIGDEDTDSPAPLTIVLSQDAMADIGDRVLLESTVPPLGSGDSVTVAFDVTLPTNVVPDLLYFLGAIVDAGNLVPEAAETNNHLVDGQGIFISGALDLVGESLAGPATACPGQTVQVSGGVRNLGNAEVRNVPVDVFLSVDPQITAADTLLATYTILVIGPGGFDGGGTQVTIPAAWAPGGSFLGMIVDPDDDFAEGDETNNIAFDASGILVNQDPGEANETLGASFLLGGPGPQMLSFAGLICPEGDRDFLRVDQTQGFLIDVDLTGLSQDLNLFLFDVNGSLLASSTNPGTAAEAILFVATYSGAYHLRVEGATGSEEDSGNFYQLDIQLE